jgi:hypothetical protein
LSATFALLVTAAVLSLLSAAAAPPSASSVLAAAAAAQDEAAQAAIEADTASREYETGGGSDPAGFRTFAEAYHWAMRAMTGEETAKVAVPAKDRIVTIDVSGSREGGVSVDPKIINAVRSEADAKRLSDLQQLGDELPEFEGEIVQLEAAVATLARKYNSSDSVAAAGKSRRPVLDDAVAALETIAELCHSVDNGLDMHAIGGLALILRLIQDPTADPQIHQSGLKAMSTCAQNSPKVAMILVDELEAVPSFLSSACTREVQSTRSRSLMALVSVCGAVHPDKCRAILSQDTVSIDHSTCAVERGWRVLSEMRVLEDDERRGAMRALALAETLLLLPYGVVSEEASEQSRRAWKVRLLEVGIDDVTSMVLSKEQHDHGEDVTEAVARLANLLHM